MKTVLSGQVGQSQRRRSRASIQVGAVVAVLWSISSAHAALAQAPYTYTSVEIPGAIITELQSINDSGQVVGDYYMDTSYQARSFLLSNNVVTLIDYPGALWTYVWAISNSGVVVGNYYTCASGYGCHHPFMYSAGVYTALPEAPGSMSGTTKPTGINSSGKIVGWYVDPCFCKPHGFVFEDGNYTTVDYPGAFATSLLSLTEDGKILGTAAPGWGIGIANGFVIDGATTTDVTLPPSHVPTGLNVGGDIVGYSNVDAFLLSGGSLTRIMYPSAVTTQVNGSAINATRQIAGSYTDDVGIVRGFIASQTTNQPPTAVAGPNRAARPGVTITLNGSGSYDDNTITSQLQFAWSITSSPGGSHASLTNAATMTPSFTPDIQGDYTIQLVVTDSGGLSSSPSFMLVGENPPPVANAGLDQLVLVSQVVSLAGSANDADGDPVSYQWTFASRPGSSTTSFASPGLPSTTFVPDVPGVYVARLTPSDFLGTGVSDDVQITVTTASGYAVIQTQSAATVVVSLPPSAVTNGGNQNALVQFLSNAATALAAGNTATALHHLQQAITRTDGCALRGTVDGNGNGRDWISTCSAQAQVYPLLTSAVAVLTQ